jgi:hypothetical protein
VAPRCHCPCHHDDETLIFRGVDTKDPIEAVIACPFCLDDHFPALDMDPEPTELPPWLRHMDTWNDDDIVS